MEIERVGDFTLQWGESLVWDDRTARLYFVDCGTNALHWLEGGAGELHTLVMPSMPTGVVPTRDGRLVVVLHDGLFLVDPDGGEGEPELLAPCPDALGGRANDACADLQGNLITGTLNLGPDEGSTWWFSSTDGWKLLDDDISNTNGPQAIVLDGTSTLIVGDSSTEYFSYPYDGDAGTVGERSVFGDTSELEGIPDGSTFDDRGGLWCALFGGAQLVRFTTDGLDQALPVPVANPTDVTFGGRDLDRLYVVSTGPPPGAGGEGAGGDGLDGGLLVIDGLGATGRLEPRVAV
jgi:sugar lactone lactonase YvrE